MSAVPENLGSYQLLEEVGVGGLGRVFKAIDRRTGQTVAVKILHDRFTSSRKFLGIFHRELLIISRLHHKHVVSYLDSGFQPPSCYIVTEFIEGWSCHAFLKLVNKAPPLVALCITMNMLQGIDYLHLHDTIHSDLSAANIMIDKNGRVLVTDFGLACQLDIEDYKNYMVGTPGYYSPEHVTEAAIIPQTDLYCAGLILYELIAGCKAVPASSDRRKVISAMKRVDFSKVVIADARMQYMVRKLLKNALQPAISKRTPSTEQMMFDIYSILKRYHIRYASHAIRKFLIDSNLSPGPFKGRDQNIYHGSV